MYCGHHGVAERQLLEKFKDWERAFGFTWVEYVGRVKANPDSGLWVKEVAAHILKEGRGE